MTRRSGIVEKPQGPPPCRLPHGKVGATLMYRSRTSGSRMPVTVKEVEKERVLILFQGDGTTWKRIEGLSGES
ncbi:unnamed protein product, partial [Prorocentrum cordatum]